MSAESLSPNQVENLLKAMEVAQRGDGLHGEGRFLGRAFEQSSLVANLAHGSTSDSVPTRPAPPAASASSRPAAHASADVPVTPYDFKQPDRIGKNQLHALWTLHDSIARNFAAAISQLLRAPLGVKLVRVDQPTYHEFVATRLKSSCISVLRPAPLDGNWLLDITPPLAFAMIDRMLGGDAVPGEPIHRPLTEIENRLMTRVAALFLEQLGPAWEPIVELRPELASMVSAPRRAPIATPGETVIEIGFDVRWGKNDGSMTLCIPYQSIAPFRSALEKPSWKACRDRNAIDPARRRIVENMDGANVDVVVTLAHSCIKTSDLMGLTVGDIITTDHRTDQPLELAIQNIPKFHASAGAYHGKKAVQVQSLIEHGRR